MVARFARGFAVPRYRPFRKTVILTSPGSKTLPFTGYHKAHNLFPARFFLSRSNLLFEVRNHEHRCSFGAHGEDGYVWIPARVVWRMAELLGVHVGDIRRRGQRHDLRTGRRRWSLSVTWREELSSVGLQSVSTSRW